MTTTRVENVWDNRSASMKLRPCCAQCGGTVSRPKKIRGQLRGDCVECGRVDATWTKR